MRFLPKTLASFRLDGTLVPLCAAEGGSETICEIGGLTVRLTHTWYTDALLETRVDITNTSGARSGQITELCGLDAAFESSGGLTWESLDGDSCSAASFLPKKQPFGERSWTEYRAEGGRSANKSGFPYFDLTDGESSVVVGVGWTGNWRYTIEKDGDLCRLRIGFTDCDFYLDPGESARSASAVVYFGKAGDSLLKTRQGFRAAMRAYLSPSFSGVSPLAFSSQAFDVYFWERSERSRRWYSEAGQLHCVDASVKCRYLDTYWLDAAWFRDGFPTGVGNYDFTPELPHGLKPISDRAHAQGMKMMVWFEPERVHSESDVWKYHRNWLLDCGESVRPGSYLFNLGNDEAREWLTDTLIRFIRDNGIDIYRQDFNMDPLLFWRMNDAPDRKGYTENRHITGLYRMWDDLLAAFPGMVIDNCSSGGRRIDVEMCRRSVPMWRSDTACWSRTPNRHTETFSQNQILGLTRYLAYHSASTWDTRAVLVRSAATDGLACEFEFLRDDLDYAPIHEALAEADMLREYWKGDFTPLTEGTADETGWAGWQLSLGDRGAAMFFRRCECEDASHTFALTGLDEAAEYEVTLSDEQRQKTVCTCPGSTLAQGLAVTLPEKMSSMLLLYRKK